MFISYLPNLNTMKFFQINIFQPSTVYCCFSVHSLIKYKKQQISHYTTADCQLSGVSHSLLLVGLAALAHDFIGIVPGNKPGSD